MTEVSTVVEAASAGLAVTITCEKCNQSHSEWACDLCLRKPAARTLPLNKIVDGFYCLGCRRAVTARISPTDLGQSAEPRPTEAT
jgi:hypothetical protein